MFKPQAAGRDNVLCGDSIHGANKSSFTILEPTLPKERGSVTMQRACQTAQLAPPPLVGVHSLCFLGL